MTGKTSFWENPHNQETTRLLVLFFFITFSITEQIVSLYSTLLVSMWVICWISLQGLTPCSKFWPGQMYFLYKFTKHIQTWPPTNIFVRETSLKNRVSTNYIVKVKLRVRPCGLLNLIRLAQRLYNKLCTQHDQTSSETKIHVRVIEQLEDKDNSQTYCKGVRLAQSLHPNLKKPLIVIALHNTLFFYRGLFKGRSHPKSPCIYLLLFNNLIYESGFQNIAIGN